MNRCSCCSQLITPFFLPTATKAAMHFSTSSVLCAAEICTRIRAFPAVEDKRRKGTSTITLKIVGRLSNITHSQKLLTNHHTSSAFFKLFGASTTDLQLTNIERGHAGWRGGGVEGWRGGGVEGWRGGGVEGWRRGSGVASLHLSLGLPKKFKYASKVTGGSHGMPQDCLVAWC